MKHFLISNYLRNPLFLSVFLGTLSRYTIIFPIIIFFVIWTGRPVFPRKKFLSILVLAILLAFVLMIHDYNMFEILKQVIRYFIPPASALCIYQIFRHHVRTYSLIPSIKVLIAAFRFTLIAYLFDVLSRLLISKNISMLSFSGAGAWESKMGTLLFLDTNFHSTLAISILTFCFYCFYLCKHSSLELPFSTRSEFKLITLLSCIVVFLGQSFSAYVSLVLLFAIYAFFAGFFMRVKAMKKLFSMVSKRALFSVFIVASVSFASLIIGYSQQSPLFTSIAKFSSLESKIFIVNKSSDLISDKRFLLFGVGPQKFQDVGNNEMLHEAHNMFGFLSESGLLLSLSLLMVVYFALPRDPTALMFCLPLFISYLIALFPLSSFCLPLLCGFLMNFMHEETNKYNRFSNKSFNSSF